MRFGALVALGLLACAAARPVDRMTAALERVSEEAEAFRMLAPKVVGRETLRQKARKKPSRFRLRVGEDALQAPKPKYQNREIISEYGFSALQDAPGALLEIRQIVSVDGRSLADHQKARETLTLGITKDDDRAKKRMLRRFEKHGLRGAATDFGQVLLLFRRRNLDRYDFSMAGTKRIGADSVLIVHFSQREGPEAFTIFQGRQVTHAKLEGEIWVRASDYVPLRIDTATKLDDGKFVTVHRGMVEYFQSALGLLLPTSVRYQQIVEEELLVDSRARYSDFQMFTVDAEIKFTPVGEADPVGVEATPQP